MATLPECVWASCIPENELHACGLTINKTYESTRFIPQWFERDEMPEIMNSALELACDHRGVDVDAVRMCAVYIPPTEGKNDGVCVIAVRP
jgi:hypothetical protein